MAVVKVDCTNLEYNPHCPHGPTLKFVRIQNGVKQEFFACSTYRDRADCPFYLAAGNKLTERMEQVWASVKQNVLPSIDHGQLEARLKEVKQASPEDRLYCHTCSELDLMARHAKHTSHNVQTNISDSLLARPSQILKLEQGSKKEAQYLFAESTVKVIVKNLKRAGVSRVLCLGTPRIHEHIQTSKGKMKSLLLDLDHRYHSFWPSDKFVWYNMFNRHVMLPCANVPTHVILQFLESEERVALVLDPPFGGHVHPLAATISHFTQKAGQLVVIWVFPYFRERDIIKNCQSLVMMDYKVQYDNHKEFNNGSRGRKLGSPVRLFTNIPPRQFVLPKAEGYRICSPCARWVSRENKHCLKCNSCTSKDGRTYVHCDKCGTCVKPQWRHCSLCHRCIPYLHSCLSTERNDEPTEPRRKKMKVQK